MWKCGELSDNRSPPALQFHWSGLGWRGEIGDGVEIDPSCYFPVVDQEDRGVPVLVCGLRKSDGSWDVPQYQMCPNSV